jgi:hypothetical protein
VGDRPEASALLRYKGKPCPRLFWKTEDDRLPRHKLPSAIHLKNKTNSDIHFSSYDARLNQSAEKEGIIILS